MSKDKKKKGTKKKFGGDKSTKKTNHTNIPKII